MQTTVYLHVGISERGCDRISLHVPQGTFLHLSTVNPVSTPSPGMHIGLRILMPLTLGSSSITPVLTPEWDVLVATTGMIKLSHGELSNKNCPELLTHETIPKCKFTCDARTFILQKALLPLLLLLVQGSQSELHPLLYWCRCCCI